MLTRRVSRMMAGTLGAMVLSWVGQPVSAMAPAALSEQAMIAQVAREYALSPFQTHVLGCLRRIEHGRKGVEFGVMHPAARDTDFLTQARWAAGSVKRRVADHHQLKPFARRWAPIGADNDPDGLNRYWLGNMTWCLDQAT